MKSHALRAMTEEEFRKLRPGDIVFLSVYGQPYQSRILGRPFWNSDADEPGWEVETSNGFSDMYSLLVY